MKTLTLTYIGNPKQVQTKYGLKDKFSVKAKEYGENFLDVWSSPQTKGWSVGQSVQVEDVTTREYNGKTYYSVVMPKAKFNNDNITRDLSLILTKMSKYDNYFRMIIEHLSGEDRLDHTSAGTKIPDFEEVGELRGEDMNFN